MKPIEEMSHEELVAEALASPARWLYAKGERDVEALKEDLRRRVEGHYLD